MPGPSPLWYRAAGAVALGAGIYGLFGTISHTAALLHPSPNDDPSAHRKDLSRDLAFLVISLPSLALLRHSRRFAERPELRLPSYKTLHHETDNELVHVIDSPTREALERVRDIEDAFYDLHMDWWTLPEKLRLPFENMDEGFERIRRALDQWDRLRDNGDEIERTRVLMEVARLKVKLSVHLAIEGKHDDGAMYEKAASIHLLVVKNHLDALNRNLEGAPANKNMPPFRERIRGLQRRVEDVIQYWSLLPETIPSRETASKRLEKASKRLASLPENASDIDAAEALIDFSLASRDRAFALRWAGDVEGFASSLADATPPMKRARRILRSLEMS